MPRPRPTCARLRAELPGAESLAPIPALVIDRASPPRLRDLTAPSTSSGSAGRRPAYAPNDLLAPKQWHLEFNRTFDYWEAPTVLPAVRVAVIDSGIDGDHPDFAGKIADAKSFVGGSARVDEEGHGDIRRRSDRGERQQHRRDRRRRVIGRALVAKVVDGNDLIDVEAEVKAIRWAVEHDAQVINMSLGGFRDPRDPDRDAFSPASRRRSAGPTGGGVVIVAAVGNNTDTPPRAVAVRELPGGIAARARSERDSAGRLRPRLLAPRQDLRRHRRARCRHPLDLPARAHRRDEGVPGAGLLELRAG